MYRRLGRPDDEGALRGVAPWRLVCWNVGEKGEMASRTGETGEKEFEFEGCSAGRPVTGVRFGIKVVPRRDFLMSGDAEGEGFG